MYRSNWFTSERDLNLLDSEREVQLLVDAWAEFRAVQICSDLWKELVILVYLSYLLPFHSSIMNIPWMLRKSFLHWSFSALQNLGSRIVQAAPSTVPYTQPLLHSLLESPARLHRGAFISTSLLLIPSYTHVHLVAGFLCEFLWYMASSGFLWCMDCVWCRSRSWILMV